MQVLIRYTYPGTTNGRPVGEVYALRLPESLVGRRGGFSYAKDPAQATAFTPSEAAALIREHGERSVWPGAQAVPLDAAEVLPDSPEDGATSVCGTCGVGITWRANATEGGRAWRPGHPGDWRDSIGSAYDRPGQIAGHKHAPAP